MSKVDWAVAESTYVTKHHVSYEFLANLFGVAKSTVVRYAVKESWPEKRQDYTQKRISALEERTLQKRLDVEERQLRTLRITQAVFHKEIIRIGLKQQNGEPISHKEWNGIAGITSAVSKAIMTERVILGLPSKPVRITDAEAIENIQVMMGYKEESPVKKEKNRQELIADTRRLLEYLERQEEHARRTNDDKM